MAKKTTDTEVVLTREQLRAITEAAAQVAIEVYHKEHERDKEECKDRRLYNTRLLMEKYKGMVVYCQEAVHTANQIDDDDELQAIVAAMSIGRDSYTLSIDSIREQAGKTRLILDHVDKMLDFYHFRCSSSGKTEVMRKWEVVNYLYLAEENKTVQELAQMYYVDERTIYRYNRAALQDISALLFGCIE